MTPGKITAGDEPRTSQSADLIASLHQGLRPFKVEAGQKSELEIASPKVAVLEYIATEPVLQRNSCRVDFQIDEDGLSLRVNLRLAARRRWAREAREARRDTMPVAAQLTKGQTERLAGRGA